MTNEDKENNNDEKSEPLTLKDIDKAFSLAYVDLIKRMKKVEEKQDELTNIILKRLNHE